MIPKKPYLAWNVNEEDFPLNGELKEKLTFLVRYALLAPSSHNTQPWKFAVRSKSILVIPDYSRALAYSDRLNRELFVSLGCALGNLIIAANHFGLTTNISYLPENEEILVAARVDFIDKKEKLLNPLFPFITTRRTNRFPYLMKKIPTEILEEIKQSNLYNDIDIHLITEEKQKSKIVNLVVKTTLNVFNDKVFTKELSEWICSFYTKRHDGIVPFDLGIPGFLSPLAPYIVRYGPAKMQANLEKKLMSSASGFLLITGKKNIREIWLKAGVAFQKVGLACEKNKIAVAPWAGLVEFEESSKLLMKILQVEEFPLFFARIGYSNKRPHQSPRRGLEEVLINV